MSQWKNAIIFFLYDDVYYAIYTFYQLLAPYWHSVQYCREIIYNSKCLYQLSRKEPTFNNRSTELKHTRGPTVLQGALRSVSIYGGNGCCIGREPSLDWKKFQPETSSVHWFHRCCLTCSLLISTLTLKGVIIGVRSKSYLLVNYHNIQVNKSNLRIYFKMIYYTVIILYKYIDFLFYNYLILYYYLNCPAINIVHIHLVST